MNSYIAIYFACVLFVLVSARPGEKYTSKYDNINVDPIIRNDRLLRNYVNCLLDKGRCNQEGELLKQLLPDAIQTSCSKCNETQKTKTRKVIHHLIENKRDWWNELEAKYDPNGTYRQKYEEEIKKEGFNI